MMQNVIIVIFQEESKTYQALSELKTRIGSSTVVEAGILKKVGGSVVVKDGYRWNTDIGSKWATGGLIGGLIGVLVGPLGMLLGASIGMMVGGISEINKQQLDRMGLIHEVSARLDEGNLALVAIADEQNAEELDTFFSHYNAITIIRRDVKFVHEEICQAQEAEKELQKQAHEKMSEEKKAEWHEKAEEIEEKIKEEVEKIKEKF